VDYSFFEKHDIVQSGVSLGASGRRT